MKNENQNLDNCNENFFQTNNNDDDEMNKTAWIIGHVLIVANKIGLRRASSSSKKNKFS